MTGTKNRLLKSPREYIPVLTIHHMRTETLPSALLTANGRNVPIQASGTEIMVGISGQLRE